MGADVSGFRLDFNENAVTVFSVGTIVIGIVVIAIGYQITATQVAMTCVDERATITGLTNTNKNLNASIARMGAILEDGSTEQTRVRTGQ